MNFVGPSLSEAAAEVPGYAKSQLAQVVAYTSGTYVQGARIIGMSLTERSRGQWLGTFRVAVQRDVVPPDQLDTYEACSGLYVIFVGGSSVFEIFDKLDLELASGDFKLRPDEFQKKAGKRRR